MADILLNKVINDEISIDLLTKWLLKVLPENEDKIFACKVAQIDFITYFINFIHEQVPCNNKVGETPQKINTPKRIDTIQCHSAREQSNAVKSNLFTSEINPTPNPNNSSNSTLDISVGKFSTPKDSKTPLNKNSNYFSPISPLYQSHQNSFSSKDSKNDHSSRKSVDKHALCLGDFLVTNSKTSKKKRVSTELQDEKKETSRRIKPTSICIRRINTEFQKTENSFNFEDSPKEVSVKSVTEQRNLLVEERTKILSRKNSIDTSSHTLLTRRCNSISKPDISPSLGEVTFKTHLDCMVTIYTTILNNKMVLNVTSEIYFLISLLLRNQPKWIHQSSNTSGQDHNSGDSNLGVEYLDQFRGTPECIGDTNEMPDKERIYNSEIFEIIHNVVYFAVRSLEAQIEIIKLYDRTTLKLLAENERIQNFSQGFSKRLLSYAERKADKPCIEIVTTQSQSNVCFNIDTDNKENFPHQTSFHAFRKQRDLFYDILRIWETYHLSSDWTFSMKLGGKVRTLFSLNCEPTNYMHLARLFKNQLLSNCAKGPKEQGLSENNLSFLPSVSIDADKLNRLTNRLVTKQTSNGINSVPLFTGYQEFYHDFIVVASNQFFNRHFSDSLISEIVELNDMKFSGIDIDEEENEINLNTRKSYINCIKNLRILAKFLGFMDSLPYRSEFPNISKNILESQIKTRHQCSPALDINLLLNRSIEKNTVVLTIPWITKYLAMLDYVTIRLPYYNSVHKILFGLYRNLQNSEMNSYNAALVKFCLGWLFELPHFPDSGYFDFCSTISVTSNDGVHGTLIKQLSPSSVSNGKRAKIKNRGLDRLSIVNQSVLYLCCPYLEGIKKLLSTNAFSSNVPVKYITPVSAVESSGEMQMKKLEQQLEDAFFSNQPMSLRKTIEFVSERIASTAVKYICHDLVPKAKEMAFKDLRENLLKDDSVDKYRDDAQRKTILRKSAYSMAQSHLSKILQTCDNEIEKISNQKIPQSLDSLLPIDTLDETKNVSVDIATKMYTEQVRQWVKSHVNLSVFSKDFDSEVQKALSSKRVDKAPFILPSGGRNCDHNEDSLSGFHLLNSIREVCCDLIEGTDVTAEIILNLLEVTYRTLTERNDINDMITVNIYHTLFDLCLLLVSNSPSLLSTNDNMMSHFIKIWTFQHKTNNLFKTLFCPRNVKILQKSINSCEAWEAYAKVISCLVEEKLIEQEELESQCTGFYNKDWEQDTLKNFSNFLKKFVIYSKCDTNDSSSFVYLLDFLSDFCSDL